MPVCLGDDFLNGVHRPQHVRHMAHGHHRCPVVERRAEVIHVKAAVCCHRHRAQRDAAALPQQLPGYYVGMVFHNAHYHLRPLGQELAHRRCHQVYALGSAAGEYDLVRGFGVDEGPYAFACRLLQVCGLLR